MSYTKITACGLCVGVLVFLVCTLSAFYLYKQRAFDQENIIFGSDPYFRSYAFAQGWGERSFIHPNLSNFINPGVRVVAYSLKTVFSYLEAEELRMRVSLMVSPMFSGLTTCVIFAITVLAGVEIVKAVSIGLLFGFSISTIAFGSVPDHFLISSFILSASVLLVQLQAKLTKRPRLLLWILMMTLGAGITISNLIPLLALFAYGEQLTHASWRDAIRKTVVVGFFSMLFTVTLWAMSNWIYGEFSSLRRDHAWHKNFGRIAVHWSDDPMRDFLAFPFTVGQAFWGGAPRVEANPVYPKPEIAIYDVKFHYRQPLDELSLRTAIQVLPILLIGMSIYCASQRGEQYLLSLAASAIVFLSFNWLLHSFWGGELFLFSPHWHFASVLGLIPLMRVYSSGFSVFLITVSSVIISVLNLMTWHRLLAVLPTLAFR